MKIIYDERMLLHRIPDGIFDSFPSSLLEKQIEQPEGADRIINTVSVLKRCPLENRLSWETPVSVTDDELLKFHTEEYLQCLKQADRSGEYLSASTYLPKGGLEVVRLAAGAVLSALRNVLSGDELMSYAISRPPNHHARPDIADGYCFINGIGLAALEAIQQGYEKIAIIDWDVHHGNGTQAGFYNRDNVLSISMHMDHGSWGASHPETGKVDEVGVDAGKGFNINLPMPFGSGDNCYTSVFEQCVVPKVQAFNPDLIILANGQDANQFDPNGRQMVTMAGYYRMACQLRNLAQEVCSGKLVITQEGGYNPTYAPLCAYAVVAGLLGVEMEIEDPIAFYPEDRIRAERDVRVLQECHPLF
jgi:acetoin utilization deacetylase AcuC-like enzyme